MLRSARSFVFIAAACAFALPFAWAEDVVTKTDGAKLRGKVIADTPEGVKIKTAGGVIDIPREEVLSVARANDLAAELALKQQGLAAHPSADGWLKLAHWCEEHELWVASLDCLKHAIKLDPDNEAARTELGYKRLRGAWVTEADWYRDQGYVQVDGRWISKEEKERLDQGLVRWGDDWITKEEADRREKEAEKQAEHDRQGVPTKPGEKPAPAEKPAPGEKPARAGKAGKEKAPRFFEGKLLYTKTPEQIAKALDQIAAEQIAPLTRPKAKAEFEPLADDLEIAALRRLKQYRYLCDVATDVDLNYDYAVKASAACRLLDLVGHLDHKPAKPPGCSEELYKVGFDGTSHSNLYQASWSPTAVQSVDAWIFDSDPSNIDRVGHRNWLLNAAQKQCAFGVFKNFAAFYAMDSARTPLPYDAVLYPARGYFPISHWQKDAAWSAHLSKDWAAAKESDVKVTVTPLDANMKKGTPVELDYFHVDGGGFGVGSSCIIFKPRATIAQGARYWVEIKGLQSSSGETTLEYLVEFY